ncbi:hypothetical protein [Frankia sp. Cj3]|uniref:hypothetical protein n=1 Tax=Frankia sp. Cj3 TaxID=2880976 RepID=UPI001EF6A3E3|nr:hypothetical protein [Frankia sp. Cj3]
MCVARREDARYWEEHRRPISSDELRKRLKVGSKRAGAVAQLRTEAHRVLEEHAANADLPKTTTAVTASHADDRAADGLPGAVGPDDVDRVDLGRVEPAGTGVLAAVG